MSIYADGLPNVSNIRSNTTSGFFEWFPYLRLKGIPQLLCDILLQMPTLLQRRKSIRQQAPTVQRHLRDKGRGIWLQMIGQKINHRYRNGITLGKGFEYSTNTHIFHQHNHRFRQHFHEHIIRTPWCFMARTRTT